MDALPVGMVGHMAMLTVLMTNWVGITNMHATLLACLMKPHRGRLGSVDHSTVRMLPVDIWEGVAAKGMWLALATDTCSPDPVTFPVQPRACSNE